MTQAHKAEPFEKSELHKTVTPMKVARAEKGEIEVPTCSWFTRAAGFSLFTHCYLREGEYTVTIGKDLLQRHKNGTTEKERFTLQSIVQDPKGNTAVFDLVNLSTEIIYTRRPGGMRPPLYYTRFNPTITTKCLKEGDTVTLDGVAIRIKKIESNNVVLDIKKGTFEK